MRKTGKTLDEYIPEPLPLNVAVATLVGAERFEFKGQRFFNGLKTFVDPSVASELEPLRSAAGAVLFKIEPL